MELWDHLRQLSSQGLSSYRPLGRARRALALEGCNMRDPGDKVALAIGQKKNTRCSEKQVGENPIISIQDSAASEFLFIA